VCREGHIFVVVRSYFDGNKSESDGRNRERRTLTLAGVVSDDDTWVEFERGWRELLESNLPKPEYVHMRELMQGDGEYARRRDGIKERTAPS